LPGFSLGFAVEFQVCLVDWAFDFQTAVKMWVAVIEWGDGQWLGEVSDGGW
jgi:hypothetical protein